MSGLGIGEAVEAADVKRLLVDLLGRGATVTAAEGPTDPHGAAWFVTDQGAPAAAITTDLDLSARLAGALSMLPPGRCEDAVKDGELDEVLAGNLGEVFNVLGVLFNKEGSAHVKLDGVGVGTPAGPAAGPAAELAAGGSGRSFDVAIEGYGGGRMRVALA